MLTHSSVLSREKEAPKIEENKIIILWSFTVWLVVMNTTMFNVALPSILVDLTLTSSTASWIVSGYSIVFAISTLTYSRLSDFIPIRRLLFIGLSLLGTSSIIGFISNSFYLLLFSRILQAAGAGAVPGLAMILASRYIPISRRGKAMAFISSASSLGFGLGPVLGGVITQFLGWSYLFLITAFVIFLLPFLFRLLPKEDVHNVKFDIVGGILTGLAVTCFLLFLSSFSYFLLFVCVLACILLWRHIHKVTPPFIQPQLLKNKPFMMLIFGGFAAFVTHFSTLFLMPMMLFVLYAKDPAGIGLIIFPGAILSALAAQYIGRFIDRFGNKYLILSGHLLLLVATILFAALSAYSPNVIMFTYMFMSTGFTAFASSIVNEVSRILEKQDIGAGMGITQLIQFFGGAFGVALTGLSLGWLDHLPPEWSFRYIFIALSILLLLSFMVFQLYLKKRAS